MVVVVAWFEARNMVTLDGPFQVVDGDSLRLGGQSLRLQGIDAPELRQDCQRDGATWACGRAARDHLRSLVRSGDLQCEGHEKDRYGRLLVTCFNASDNVNAMMVGSGFAVAFGRYEREERMARDAGRGLWAGEFMRPADWRERDGQVAETQHAWSLVRRGMDMVKALFAAWR